MAIFQNKAVVLILGSVLATVAVWYVFLRDTAVAPLLETEDLTAATSADKDVVETLLALRSITLSGTIFTDPAFIKLKDTGTQIVPEPVGRPNPFLPLEGSKTVSTSTPSASPAGGR